MKQNKKFVKTVFFLWRGKNTGKKTPATMPRGKKVRKEAHDDIILEEYDKEQTKKYKYLNCNTRFYLLTKQK
jgi:hypothetical protein